MDDLHFRRSILSEPKYRDEDINQAIANDAAKLKFIQEVDVLDKKINQAMDIPVPDDLRHKLILRQTLSNHRQQQKKRVYFALAASVAVVLGVSLNFMLFSHSYKNLADYAIAHTMHEAHNFSNNDIVQVSLTSLNKKMANFDGMFTSTIGQVIFADYCRFDGTKSLHLVFQGKTSPVNVFVIPKKSDMTFIENFSNEELHGLSHHFKHSNVIIVADKSESLTKWQSKLQENTTWSI